MSAHTPSEDHHTLLWHSKSDTFKKTFGIKSGKSSNIFIKASLCQIPPGHSGSLESQAGLALGDFFALKVE